MKNKRKIDFSNVITIFIYILIVLFVLLVLGVAATVIYCWIKYGGKPVGEIPGWAFWFMFGGRR